MLLIILCLSFFTCFNSLAVAAEPSSPAALAAQHCPTCSVPGGNASITLSQLPVPEIRPEKAADHPADKQCDMKTLLVDPKQKSILQDFGMSYEGNDPMVIVGRSSLTCLYGALEGGAKSIRDLVMLIPQILGLSFDALKAVSGSLTKANLHAILSALKPQNVIEKGGHAFAVTTNTISSAFHRASAKLYSAYEQGGATGAVAAAAQAAYASSPHQIVGKFLANLAVGIGHAVAEEWKGFTCLPPEAMSQVICEVIGYIGADIVTGKIAVSALSKAPKLATVLAKLKPVFEDKPIIGQWLMRDLKATDGAKCAAISEGLWMTDARLNLQAKAVDVAVVDKKLFARGIDPSTKKMGCFEVAGNFAATIMRRIASTEERSLAAEAAAKLETPLRPASPGGPDAAAVFARTSEEAPALASVATREAQLSPAIELGEFYSARSRAVARTTKDFVADVNERSGLAIRAKQSAAVSQFLDKSPEVAEQYGRILEELGALRQASKGALPADIKKLAANLRESEELVKKLNSILASPAHAATYADALNLKLLRSALDEAKQTGDASSIKILNRALSEFAKNMKPKTSIQEAILAWEKNLKKNNSSLSDATIQQARRCLFGDGGL